jgi:hypothetical protein
MPLGMQSSDFFWRILSFFPALLPFVSHAQLLHQRHSDRVGALGDDQRLQRKLGCKVSASCVVKMA